MEQNTGKQKVSQTWSNGIYTAAAICVIKNKPKSMTAKEYAIQIREKLLNKVPYNCCYEIDSGYNK